MIELRQKSRGEVVKHDCGAGRPQEEKPKKVVPKRHVCEMELRGIVDPPAIEDVDISAH